MNEMYFKLVTSVLVAGVLCGCNGEDSEEEKSELSVSGFSEPCLEKVLSLSSGELLGVSGFGSGVDGEFYLSSGETFLLEEREYNFTNVNLDSGSFLGITNESINGIGVVKINSLGVCNIFGDIDTSGYGGEIAINCYSGITIGGRLTHPDGSIALVTAETIGWENIETNSGENGETTLLVGSIDLSDSELNLREDGVVIGGGEVDLQLVNVLPETIICSD